MFQKIALPSWFYAHFFMILYMYIALGQGRQPIRAKILMSTGRPHHYGHELQVKNLQPLTLFTSFHDSINVYSRRSGADNPRGQNFDGNRNLLSLQSFATSLKNNLFEVWFYTILFMMLYMYMYIALGQGLTTPWGQNFDVNSNILSLWSFVASLKKSLRSLFLYFFFSWFYTYI